MEKPTEFDYLLNRMEHAGQQEAPAEHHYGVHRASLIRHVRALEKDAERYRWLRNLMAAEDVARLVDEYLQWSWCETDPAESAKTDAAVDKAMADGLGPTQRRG